MPGRSGCMDTQDEDKARCQVGAGELGSPHLAGAPTWSKSSAPAYGVLKVKLPYPAGHCRARTMSREAHVVAFLLSNIHLRDLILGRRQFDLSHRSHWSRCINADPLSAEPRSISNARKQCKEGGSCLGHADYSSCLL